MKRVKCFFFFLTLLTLAGCGSKTITTDTIAANYEAMYPDHSVDQNTIDQRDISLFFMNQASGGYFELTQDPELNAILLSPEDAQWDDLFAPGASKENEYYQIFMSTLLTLSQSIYEDTGGWLVVTSPSDEDTVLLWLVDDIIAYNQIDGWEE